MKTVQYGTIEKHRHAKGEAIPMASVNVEPSSEATAGFKEYCAALFEDTQAKLNAGLLSSLALRRETLAAEGVKSFLMASLERLVHPRWSANLEFSIKLHQAYTPRLDKRLGFAFDVAAGHFTGGQRMECHSVLEFSHHL